MEAVRTGPSGEIDRAGEAYGLVTGPMPGDLKSARRTRANVVRNRASLAFSAVERITSRSLYWNCPLKSILAWAATDADCDPGTSKPPWESRSLNFFSGTKAANKIKTQIPSTHKRRRYAKDPSR